MKKKKNIIRITLPIIIVLIFQTSFCQKNYIPGYIIRLNGDTVKGYVDYHNWTNNPRKIFFKKILDENEITYTPVDIKGFGVSGKVFKSAEIITEITPEISGITDQEMILSFYAMQLDNKFNIEYDKAFIQALVEGRISLFYYKNRVGKEQFYIKQDTSKDFELLLQKKYLLRKTMQANNSGHSSTLEPFTPNSEIGSSDKSNMDTTYDFLVQRKSFVMDTLRGSDIKYLKILEVYERDKYFDQLLPYFQGCSPVESKIRKTRYSQSSLTKLFLSYYSNCSQSKVAFQKQEEKASGEFGVLTGVSISTIRFGNAIGVDYLSNTVFPHSTNFSAGLFYNFILRETQKRWSICNDLIYTSYMLNGVYNNYQDVYNSTTSQTKIGYSYLILNDMLRYNCPIGEGDWSMFFNVGISNGFGFNETNYENEQTMVWSIKNSINGKALNDTRKYEPGFIAGLGVKNKKFSFDARFEIGSGITQDILSEKSLTSRFFFLLGYRIK